MPDPIKMLIANAWGKLKEKKGHPGGCPKVEPKGGWVQRE
jgi:hypothetical protein